MYNKQSELVFMRINVNLASLNIFNAQQKNMKDQSTALNRLSSGRKFSTAAENPNAIAQSERLDMEIRGMTMAQRNMQDGMSMLQTGEGGLNNIASLLQRVRELAVQAGGGNNSSDNQIIQNEIKQTLSGIDDIAKNTEFNGVKMLNDGDVTDNNSPLNMSMSIGYNSNESANIPKYNLSPDLLGDPSSGNVLSNIDVTAPDGVNNALTAVDKALSTVLDASSKYGALENRFEDTYNMSQSISENVQRAQSNLDDADISEEMINYARDGVLIDAGNALMVQSNRLPQEALEILRNVK